MDRAADIAAVVDTAAMDRATNIAEAAANIAEAATVVGRATAEGRAIEAAEGKAVKDMAVEDIVVEGRAAVDIAAKDRAVEGGILG